MHIVWFKRDLRTVDHAALSMAAASGPVTALYVVEPEYWSLPDIGIRMAIQSSNPYEGNVTGLAYA
jgi:deoxyribodipyrimidine photo-lyase